MWRIRYFLLVITFLIISREIASPVNVDINSDIYGLLQKLEAEGLIQSSMLATKPVSRQETIRLILEAEKNAEDQSPFIRKIVSDLKDRFKDEIENEKFIKPVADPYGQYIYSDSDLNRLTYNNDGYSYKKGSNLRLGVFSTTHLQDLSFHINPEIRNSEDDTILESNKVYGILNFSEFELEFGKDSQWWGPGNHGALLLTNNAEPLTALKLTNQHPVFLPSLLKHLGLFKFVFFVTKLENNRVISNPFFWGMRINFKPAPYFEIGLSRTAMLGGDGRPDDFKTWGKSFLGIGENVEGTGGVGNQIGGMDLKITFPFGWQPFQLYGEYAGEDEAGGLPSRNGYLGGIYLPRINKMERFSLRFEYAINHVNGHPDLWYNHGIYRSGYTYRNRIIGHHMGTDSEDIYFETQYFLPKPDNSMLSFAYNREKHNLSDTINETSDEFSLKINLPLKKELNIKTIFTFGTIKNLNMVKGADTEISILMSHLTYKF